jgi:hypothetical protein
MKKPSASVAARARPAAHVRKRPARAKAADKPTTVAADRSRKKDTRPQFTPRLESRVSCETDTYRTPSPKKRAPRSPPQLRSQMPSRQATLLAPLHELDEWDSLTDQEKLLRLECAAEAVTPEWLRAHRDN